MQISREMVPRWILNFFKEIPDSGIQSISVAKRKTVRVDNAYNTVSKTEVKRIIEDMESLNMLKDWGLTVEPI